MANFILHFVKFFTGLPASTYKICLVQNKIFSLSLKHENLNRLVVLFLASGKPGTGRYCCARSYHRQRRANVIIYWLEEVEGGGVLVAVGNTVGAGRGRTVKVRTLWLMGPVVAGADKQGQKMGQSEFPFTQTQIT